MSSGVDVSTRPSTRRIHLEVNEEGHVLDVAVNATLLDVLRDQLGLTGTKYSCGIGECGACTVLLDGKPVLSCEMLAVWADGCRVTTIEGLSSADEFHPLQIAFADLGAIQCGYCTPGMIVTAKALLAENPSPTREEIRRYLGGNLCRCTGYVKIVDAVQEAARQLQAGGLE